MAEERDTEMGDDTRGSGAAFTELRRASGVSTVTSATAPPSSASSQGTVSGFPQQPPPGSASANTSRRSSLANLVHDMDVGSGPGLESQPEVIEVEADEEDDEVDEEGEEGEGVEEEHYAGEEGEGEEGEDDEDEDEDSEDSEDDEDDEASEDDTDVPTATPTASTSRHGRESSKPNNRSSPTPATLSAPPVMRRSISITELTDNGVDGPLPSNHPTPGSATSAEQSQPRKGISIPVLLHPSNEPSPNGTGGSSSGITVTVTDTSTNNATSIPPNSSTSTLTAAPISPNIVPLDDPSAGASMSISAPVSKKGAKPRSKVGKQRTPSPSPPPMPPPPPMQTIRLDIKLGGPSNYEVDVSLMAKETGQRPATPPLPVVLPVESEEEKEVEVSLPEGKKKRKKKNAAQEYYDTSDPFIDDSELAVDQRTYFAQTKQQGFYVSSGEVALLKDTKSPKKPKSKKPGLTAALHSSASQAVSAGVQLKKEGSISMEGGQPSPLGSEHQDPLGLSNNLKGMGINIPNGQNQDAKGKKPENGANTTGWTAGLPDEEGDEKTGQKRKRYITVVENGKKRKIVNIGSFNAELQAAIEDLKKLINQENWEQKGKFPPSLKPPLAQLALLAIRLDEYDDHFFNLMPTLFPYNKFTMTKLIKRTVYPDHVALLQERQEELLKQLEALAKAGFTKAEEEWEKNFAAWDKRQEKMRLEAANAGGTASGGDGNGSGSNSAAPTRHPTEEKDGMDVDNPGSVSAPPGAGGGGANANANAAAHPPAKKYRLTEQMKAIIWDLVLLSNECCRLENEKNGYEGSAIQVSEQGLRKVLYQKIVAAFPEGWMSSGQISRDVSAMKKRLEKEAMENE